MCVNHEGLSEKDKLGLLSLVVAVDDRFHQAVSKCSLQGGYTCIVPRGTASYFGEVSACQHWEQSIRNGLDAGGFLYFSEARRREFGLKILQAFPDLKRIAFECHGGVDGLNGSLDRQAFGAVSALKNLKALDILGCRITDMSALSSLTQLTQLYLFEVPIDDISPIYPLHQLTQVVLEDTAIKNLDGLSNKTALRALKISSSQVVDLTDLVGLINLRELNLIYTTNGRPEEYLDLSTIRTMVNLERLDISGNQIRSLQDLRELSWLKSLRFFDGGIVDLTPLADLRNLEEIDAGRNRILDFSPVLNLGKLRMLDLTENPVTNVNVLNDLRSRGVQLDSIGNQPFPFLPQNPVE